MADQADVDRWAEIIARAYVWAHHPKLSAADETRVARELNTPLADCVMLAIPPADWGPYRVNPALQRWERMAGRGPGPRLQAVNLVTGIVTVR